MLQCNLLRRGVTISPWMHTFTLVYLFLCVFFCRVTIQYFATHTHTHTPRSCQVCRVLMLADSSAWDGCRLWYRDMRSLTGVCLQWRRKKKKWTLTCTPADAASIHKQQPETVFTYRATHTHTHRKWFTTESWHTPLLHVRRDVMSEISSGLSVCISRRQRQKAEDVFTSLM